MAEVVKGITVSNYTYILGWTPFTERYDKPCRLASSIVESLLSASVAQQENVASLNTFLNTFDESVALLNSLNFPDLEAFLLWPFTMAAPCLPVSSRCFFESVNTSEFPNVYDLLKFIKERVHVLENAGAAVGSSKPRLLAADSKPRKELYRQDRLIASLLATNSLDSRSNEHFPNCKGAYLLKSCPGFLKMTVRERFEVVSKL